LGLVGDGSNGLSLLAKYERTLASIKVDSSGQPRLSLSNRNGKSHAVLGMTSPKPVLVFLDKEKNITWKTP